MRGEGARGFSFTPIARTFAILRLSSGRSRIAARQRPAPTICDPPAIAAQAAEIVGRAPGGMHSKHACHALIARALGAYVGDKRRGQCLPERRPDGAANSLLIRRNCDRRRHSGAICADIVLPRILRCIVSYRLELTDTFAGEANYSWVRRGEIAASGDTSRVAIVRRAKKWAGLSGLRCRVYDYGDAIDIRPHGRCVVLFVIWSSE